MLQRFIRIFRGDNFILDEKIPKMYLIYLCLEKIIALCYGILCLKTLKLVFVSPSSIIKGKSKFKVGNKIQIAPRCYIDAMGCMGVSCGEGVSFGRNTTMIVSGSLRQLGKGITIGNNVGLGTHGFYGGAGGLEIGDDTIFGNYVSIHPENHNFSDASIPIRLQGVNHKGIKIGKGCWIGAKATILDGTIIGDGCIVAAGAVVSGEFPDNVIIGGVPGKIIRKRISNE